MYPFIEYRGRLASPFKWNGVWLIRDNGALGVGLYVGPNGDWAPQGTYSERLAHFATGDEAMRFLEGSVVKKKRKRMHVPLY